MTNKNQTMQMEQYQSQIALLESELRQKDRQIADLEYELQRKEERKSLERVIPVRTRSEIPSSGANSISTPSAIQIQKALKNAGYYTGSIDGKIGTKTREAIKKFQKDNGLKVDGKVGKMTWAQLKFYLN
jgi:peptidoglycan hydrolase-like protein with peptidoglycan-binding domain